MRTSRAAWRRLPELPRLLGSRAQRYNGLDLRANEERVEPAVAVGNQALVFSRARLHAAVHAVEERVDEYVAPGDAKLSKEALKAATRFPH